MDRQLEELAERRNEGALALFAGGSASERQQAAQALATGMGVALTALSLPDLITKYIGETEKNIDGVFADAERETVVLLFDEADALFGNRTDVRDSHDRYANLEVSYLLERIEAYKGIVILATNSRDDLEPALIKQCRHIVDFPGGKVS